MHLQQTILVVDDLHASRKILNLVLSQAGYRVLTACDGRKALDVVQAEKPDLILLDVVMPVMGGTEVLQELKSRDDTRLIPIIMLSVRAAVTDRIEGLTHGADDYIGKPYDHDELLAKIRTHLKISALNQQLRQAEKLAVLAQVAVSVNHQVNNPLSSILYGVDLIEMTVKEDATELRSQLKIIRDSVDQIRSVIARLRNATELIPEKYLGDIQMLKL